MAFNLKASQNKHCEDSIYTNCMRRMQLHSLVAGIMPCPQLKHITNVHVPFPDVYPIMKYIISRTCIHALVELHKWIVSLIGLFLQHLGMLEWRIVLHFGTASFSRCGLESVYM